MKDEKYSSSGGRDKKSEIRKVRWNGKIKILKVRGEEWMQEFSHLGGSSWNGWKVRNTEG